MVEIYKRSSNILNYEINKNKLELTDTVDTGLFKNDFEKNLIKKFKKQRNIF